jgi:plasmid virulence protein D
MGLILIMTKFFKKKQYDKFTIVVRSEDVYAEDVFKPKKQEKRVYRALVFQKLQQNIDVDNLSQNQLKKYARKTNAARFHFSGNCRLLSEIFMFNMLNKKGDFLSAKNIYPIFKGADEISPTLFGQSLKLYLEPQENKPKDSDHFYHNNTTHLVDQLEQRLLNCFQSTGQRVFKIDASTWFPIFGRIGHCFNAVILMDNTQQPYVQFVDAWRSSNPLPTKQYLSKKYPPKDAMFSFHYCENPGLISDISLENANEKAIQIKGNQFGI